jgi:hypothetical protein
VVTGMALTMPASVVSGLVNARVLLVGSLH